MFAIPRVRSGGQPKSLILIHVLNLSDVCSHAAPVNPQSIASGRFKTELEQGIDTATAEGRAMFGMLSVLAEFSVIWTRRDAHLPDLGVAA
ncbi:hypothetical protein [Rhodococcus opacus]|uniref:hypothetical protein n=1 Tax=Rhodococcus opacus TaxID=37919 RepID=UPI002953DA98|nr:hypothetical protein [Rhodococcus opacus]MDV7089960.1 hypothetical protein [Rhodococcus opacus]